MVEGYSHCTSGGHHRYATRKQRETKQSRANHDTSSSNVGAHGQLVSRRDPSGMKPISETVIIRRSLGNL